MKINKLTVSMLLSLGVMGLGQVARAADGELLEIEVSGPLTTSTPALYLGAAEAGLGLAYCYEEEVSDALAAGRLVTVLADWSPTFAGFHLYYPSRHQLGQGLRALIDMLKAHHSPQD